MFAQPRLAFNQLGAVGTRPQLAALKLLLFQAGYARRHDQAMNQCHGKEQHAVEPKPAKASALRLRDGPRQTAEQTPDDQPTDEHFHAALPYFPSRRGASCPCSCGRCMSESFLGPGKMCARPYRRSVIAFVQRSAS